MLVSSSQSSAQRPLGLSVEELFALDRQYRRIEQQQQQLAQLQAQSRATSANLNRLSSRSLDLVSSSSNGLTVLPSLEVHGYAYANRALPLSSALPNYPRSHSNDQLRYTAVPPPAPALKSSYQPRSTHNEPAYSLPYSAKYRSHFQSPMISAGTPPSLASSYMSHRPAATMDYSDNRASCRLRRRPPIKRESSRRILVRPVVHRRREPSISSSCESLDDRRTSQLPMATEQSNQPVAFEPSSSLVEDVIDDLMEETKRLSKRDSFSEDGEVNLYEMRVPIGKTYDTSDISVQLEGAKILVFCQTIEPTDRRGNYRKHEFKTELLVPDVVDDETIVSYLTEQGELIVEGKYHAWAWKQMKAQRRQELKDARPIPPTNSSHLTSVKYDGTDVEPKRLTPSVSLPDNPPPPPPWKLKASEQSRTPAYSILEPIASSLFDGQYWFTKDKPSILMYHLRLPFETYMDAIRVQSDPQLDLLRIFIEQQEKSSFEHEHNPSIVRSTSRICRLPRDHLYDYNQLRIVFLKENFIRIELPTLV